jgi:dTDP-4-amino-4,6-dideoxygalactose transaminase
LVLTAERAASRIVTTDEVLTEYLTFFATAPESLRREAAESVVDILASSVGADMLLLQSHTKH